MKDFRIEIRVDVEADTLKEAYQKMRASLIGGTDAATDETLPLNWETTDAWWFAPNEDDWPEYQDEDWIPGDPRVLSEAIISSLKDEPPEIGKRCVECGNTDLLYDSWSKWDTGRQAFVHADTCDSAGPVCISQTCNGANVDIEDYEL